MGYYSEVVIALSKETYVRHTLVQQTLPELLKTAPVTTDIGMFWSLQDYKWYPTFPEVQEVEAFFSTLDDEASTYGAMRLGESYGDIQEWGVPSDYEIYANHSIGTPI